MDVICVHGIVSHCCASPTSVFQCQALLNWPPLIDGDAGLAVDWLEFTLALIYILALHTLKWKAMLSGIYWKFVVSCVWERSGEQPDESSLVKWHFWLNIQGLWQLGDVMGQEFKI